MMKGLTTGITMSRAFTAVKPFVAGGDAQFIGKKLASIGLGVGGADVGRLINGGSQQSAGDGLGHVPRADESDGGLA